MQAGASRPWAAPSPTAGASRTSRSTAFSWGPGWRLAPEAAYEARHAALIARDAWVVDGLGHRASIAPRLMRATAIVLVDMPIWMHFWLASERQIAWVQRGSGVPPGGQAAMPPMRELFRTIAEVDATWMPEVRSLCAAAERRGTPITRIGDIETLTAFGRDPGAPVPNPPTGSA